ncbi:tetratricopeptide repeat protein [Allomuricauda sp. F6463D]|uniref:tetratricopeptide repeat protein n=1 Tax=Allomuricauda sp. F6463D TaxID=2926409 RepID=UPI001FF28C71|nr:DUF3761 domain-containing protein [Muricauda sp. F6463D]MCK0160296.1 DUF3761 domain-containing protein [Muricauda sp. F6463D]
MENKNKSTGKLILKGCLFSLLGFISLMFLIAIISVIFFPDDEANENYNEAKIEFESKNYEKALSLVNESIKLDSLNINSDYFILKGKIEKNQGDTIQFKRDFNIALNSIKNDTVKYNKIIELHEWSLSQKDTVYSKELLKVSLFSFSTKDSTNYTNSHLNAHNKYLDLRDTIAGLDSYIRLCDSIPNPLIFNQIGIYYSNKQNTKNAIKYYTKAIELDTTNGVYYNNLGISYENIKNKKRAIKYYRLGVQYENRDACNNLRNITAKTRYKKIARCWDGTMSYSSGRGTCSHHGGVRRYENEPYKEYTMDGDCK